MRARLVWALAVVGALSGVVFAQACAEAVRRRRLRKGEVRGSVAAGVDGRAGPDGTITRITDRKGTLMYTRDGRTSVQIQFPESQSSLSNDYVLNGYEASFRTFEVNDEAQTITRHVEGSIT